MTLYKNHHVSINVTDIDNSTKFYKILGFVEVYRYADDSVTIVHLLNQNFLIELFRYSNAPQTKSIPNDVEHSDIIGIDHFSLQVDDIHEAFEELKNYSDCSNVSRGRTEIDYFFIADPDNNRIEIVKDTRRLHRFKLS